MQFQDRGLCEGNTGGAMSVFFLFYFSLGGGGGIVCHDEVVCSFFLEGRGDGLFTLVDITVEVGVVEGVNHG